MKIIFAEKPSVAKLIKSSLKDDSYEYYCVSGHISTINYEKFQDIPWAKVSLDQLLKDNFKFIYPKQRGLTDLLKIKKGAVIDELILALDPDIEGKFIEKEILNYLELKEVKIKNLNTVALEALSKKDIKLAFANKVKYDCTLAFPGELRTRLDFLFGTILTRYASLTLLKQDKFWKTYHTGRVQTPTLYQIYAREKEIHDFKSKDYYALRLKLLKHDYQVVLKQYDDLVTLNKDISDSYDVKLKEKTQLIVDPKSGLNTEQLLKHLAQEHACFKKLGANVTKTLNNMYLSGKISYPRVENNSYANYKDLLETFAKNYSANFKLEAKIPVLNPSAKVTDHGPITPLVLLDEVEDEFEKKILQTLYKHAKTMFSGSNIYDNYKYQINYSSNKQQFQILVIVEKNFEDNLKSIIKMDSDLTTKEDLNLYYTAETTKPNKYYSPSTLIATMTRHRLGTKSTKPAIIQSLIDHKYVYFFDKYYLKTTSAGQKIITFWEKHFKAITEPILTANIESIFKKLSTYNDILEVEKDYRLLLINNLKNN